MRQRGLMKCTGPGRLMMHVYLEKTSHYCLRSSSRSAKEIVVSTRQLDKGVNCVVGLTREVTE